MTTYKFKAGYTKLGVATAPSVAPVCTVVDSANDVLASAQATTPLSNLVGVYLYSYTGAAGLDLVALFHTADATIDQQDLFSYTPDILTTNLDGLISAIPAAVWAVATSTLTAVGSIGKLLVDNINAAIASRQTLGAGSTSTPITINDGTNPLDGVDVWASTDAPGSNVVARGSTDVFGLVTFMLDPGTYYIWKTLAGYNFSNPSTLVVT